MDWFLFWDCLAVIGAIVVHRWAGIAVARYADGDPSPAPSVASLVARSADGLDHAIRGRFGGRAMSLRFAGLSVLGALVLGGVPVVAGSLVFAPAPVETIAFAGRFFAAPVDPRTVAPLRFPAMAWTTRRTALSCMDAPGWTQAGVCWYAPGQEMTPKRGRNRRSGP